MWHATRILQAALKGQIASCLNIFFLQKSLKPWSRVYFSKLIRPGMKHPLTVIRPRNPKSQKVPALSPNFWAPNVGSATVISGLQTWLCRGAVAINAWLTLCGAAGQGCCSGAERCAPTPTCSAWWEPRHGPQTVCGDEPGQKETGGSGAKGKGAARAEHWDLRESTTPPLPASSVSALQLAALRIRLCARAAHWLHSQALCLPCSSVSTSVRAEAPDRGEEEELARRFKSKQRAVMRGLVLA